MWDNGAYEQSWIDPIPYPTRMSNYPIIDGPRITRAMATEMRTDWYQAVCDGDGQLQPSFTGNVWSIQLTARPGYYVTPTQIIQASFEGDVGGDPYAQYPY
jgi:hypothetical protein